MKESLAQWGEELKEFRLPRWDELPDIDLYMDQVITLVERYISPVIQTDKQKVLTSSMVNNYVKLGMIPAPVKKKYERRHLAFLIAITILKQVLTIPEVKQGILFQAAVIGIREAYDLFCEEQEQAIQIIVAQVSGEEPIQVFEQKIDAEFLAVKAATLSFALKILSEQSVILEQKYLEKLKEQKK